MAKKVDDIVHHKSGITVPFFLDKTTFYCDCLEKRFSAPDASVLEAQVLDYIEHWMNLDWHPVINVECSDSDGWGSSKKTGVWLEVKRVYLSRSPVGLVLECPWDVDPEHRKASCHGVSERSLKLTRLPLVAPLKIGRTNTWMDYTEEKWNALQSIAKGIDQLSAMLVKLITTRDGNDLLERHDTAMRLWSGDNFNKQITDGTIHTTGPGSGP
jgi:hypothetical protein